jgi:hypothetical protein
MADPRPTTCVIDTPQVQPYLPLSRKRAFKNPIRCGFEVKKLLEFNRIGTVGWFLNGKVLRRRKFGLLQILALNALTPLLRVIDRLLPLSSLSLIAVLERAPENAGARTAAA